MGKWDKYAVEEPKKNKWEQYAEPVKEDKWSKYISTPAVEAAPVTEPEPILPSWAKSGIAYKPESMQAKGDTLGSTTAQKGMQSGISAEQRLLTPTQAGKQFGSGVKGLIQGATTDTARSIGGILRWAGADTAGEGINKIADWIDKKAGLEAEDPEFQQTLGRMAGGVLSSWIPGVGVSKGVKAVNYLQKLPKLASLLGLTTMSLVQTTMQAGNEYNAMKARGKSDEEANKAAATSWGLNMPTDMLLNNWAFNKFPEGKKLVSTLLAAGQGATNGFLNEVYSAVAKGEPVNMSRAAGGAVGGGLTATAIKTGTGLFGRKAPQAEAPEPKGTIKDIIGPQKAAEVEAVKTGLPRAKPKTISKIDTSKLSDLDKQIAEAYNEHNNIWDAVDVYKQNKIATAPVATDLKMGVRVRAADYNNVGMVVSYNAETGRAKVRFTNKAKGTSALVDMNASTLTRIEGLGASKKKGEIKQEEIDWIKNRIAGWDKIETTVPLSKKTESEQIETVKQSEQLPLGDIQQKVILPELDVTGNKRIRTFLDRVERTTPNESAREGMKELPQDYEQFSSTKSYKIAQDWIKEGGEDNPLAAKDWVMSDKEGFTPQKGVMGAALIDHYQKTGDGDNEQIITDYLDKQFRIGGQITQTAALYKKMSGNAWYSKFRKFLDDKKINISDIPEEQMTLIKDRFAQISRFDKDDPARSDALEKAILFATEQIPNKYLRGDIFNALRYTNMLSSPVTHMVNITQNALNVMGYQAGKTAFKKGGVGAAVKYEADLLRSLPDAFRSAKKAFSKPSLFEEGQVDVSPDKGVFAEGLRRRIPKPLRITGDALNAADKFFSTMVEAGESTRLIGQGMDKTQAAEIAKKLGQKILYRDTIRSFGEIKADKDTAAAVKAIETLGALAQNATKAPGLIGAGAQALMPFVRTSTNIVKQGVQATPFSLKRAPVRGKGETDARFTERMEIWKDNQAQALLGSMVMLAGGALAAGGRTTGAMAKDKEARELEYASGRKSWTVDVAGKWIPMAAFGMGFVPLALGTVIHDTIFDNPAIVKDKDWMDNIMWAIGESSRLITQPTSMKGMKSFVGAFMGEYDYEFKAVAGFAASQIVPVSAAQRFMNKIIDPRFVKSNTFVDSFRQNIMGLTGEVKGLGLKKIEAYKTPEGKEATREKTEIFSPYPFTGEKPKYEKAFRKRIGTLQKKENEKK